jgi:amino acid adenylation domain-containing protein
VSRLEFLMADAGIDLLLSTGEHLERLPAWRDLAVDVGESPWAGQATSDPEPLAVPDNIAYVIYTSGSTGTPKGAMISHRTLERRLGWMQSVYRLAEGERVLHKASTGFDVAVWETLWPLRTGAAVVVARPGGHQDAAYLRRRIVEERVNLVHFVPSMLELFLSEPEIESCASLRIVLSGGEPLSSELLGRCRERLPGHLYNQYGMTEACIDVTFWSTRGAAGPGPVPIGRPYGDTAVHLLDGTLRPVPIGAVGDLWVGGDEGLLRGYRGAPHRTAIALLPDPLSGRPGSRLYRTGDRARRRPDGTVVYLGRADNQIKLRGLRVAPEEIEGALRQHSEVEQAAVVSRDQRLVAYVKPSAGQSPSSEELRRHLRGRLPEAMIPSMFVLVDGFPKTPSGKLDRLALVRRELARPEAAQDGSGPRTPFEALVAQVWTEVLGVERVGPADNFFELGGHSLFAAQVVSRLRQKHGVTLPLRTAFQKQTLAELAHEVERRLRGEDAEDDVPPIAPASEASAPIPMTLAQKPFWHERHLEVAPSTLPIVLRLEGDLDRFALRESLRLLVERHSILRTTFGEGEGGPVQLIHVPRPVDLPLVDLEGLPSAAQRGQFDRLMPDLLRRPWDLETSPLFRALLLRASTREHVFAFFCHHILLDGWAIGIFLRELESLYRSLVSGRSPALLPLELQYQDFALWQHRYLQSRAARTHQDYWRARFADAAEPTSLPLDRPAPVQPTLLSATLMLTVPPALLDPVRELAGREGKTLFMVILAALKTMLFHQTRREDLAVMSLYANRNHAEVEDLLGSFYTFLPLRTRLSADQSFRELLASVQETTLGGYSHSDAIPEDVLARVWARRGGEAGERGISRILFALQNLPGSFDDFGGLKMQSVPADSNRIRFDTSFFFYEWPGGLQVRLRYSTELFDEASAKRWFEDFLHILGAAVEDPGAPLSQLLPNSPARMEAELVPSCRP